MNWYIEETIEKYKRGGIISVLLSGIKYTFLKGSKLLLKLSDEIPTTICQSKIIEKNKIFKEMHKNCRCFIIGNGLSLKKHDLSLLKNEITFAVNAFWKYPTIKEWQPTYYCLADPVFFDGSDIMRNFFKDMFLRINNSKLFVPHYSRKLIKNNQLPFPKEKTYYIAFRGDLSRKIQPSIDITNYIPGVINVVGLAIMIAIYMGCTPIYLIGADHDWLSNRNNDSHFYTGKLVNNHIKISGSLANEPYKITIERVLKLWQGYENLSRYSTKRDIEIINASKGGFLDVFKRIDYDSIFNKKGTHRL